MWYHQINNYRLKKNTYAPKTATPQEANFKELSNTGTEWKGKGTIS